MGMAKCKDCEYYGVCILNRRSADADVTGCKIYEIKRDFVEVVRCKDCKHMEVTPDSLRWCNVWNGINGMGDEGFCNYGERREGE